MNNEQHKLDEITLHECVNAVNGVIKTEYPIKKVLEFDVLDDEFDCSVSLINGVKVECRSFGRECKAKVVYTTHRVLDLIQRIESITGNELKLTYPLNFKGMYVTYQSDTLVKNSIGAGA